MPSGGEYLIGSADVLGACITFQKSTRPSPRLLGAKPDYHHFIASETLHDLHNGSCRC